MSGLRLVLTTHFLSFGSHNLHIPGETCLDLSQKTLALGARAPRPRDRSSGNPPGKDQPGRPQNKPLPSARNTMRNRPALARTTPADMLSLDAKKTRTINPGAAAAACLCPQENRIRTWQSRTTRQNPSKRVHLRSSKADGHVLYARLATCSDYEQLLSATPRCSRAGRKPGGRSRINRGRPPGLAGLSKNGTRKPSVLSENASRTSFPPASVKSPHVPVSALAAIPRAGSITSMSDKVPLPPTPEPLLLCSRYI